VSGAEHGEHVHFLLEHLEGARMELDRAGCPEGQSSRVAMYLILAVLLRAPSDRSRAEAVRAYPEEV
jgi:hypothetical protein